jgi:hypothetical protein
MHFVRSILGAALLPLTALGYAQEVHDWKFVGCDDTDPRQPCFFFQPSEIKKLPAGDIQVWTMSLGKQQLKQRNLSKDNVDEAAMKAAAGYEPPYAKINKLNKDQRLEIIASEGAANEGSLHPISRMLFEIDCEQAEFRTLNVITDEGAPTTSASPWFHAPPGGMTHFLVALTCKQS